MIWISILTMAIVTYFIRLAPFVVFNKHQQTPAWVAYTGKYLPPAVMGMLVVYSVKDLNFMDLGSLVPMLAAMALTALVHLWKRNNLFSILGGTIFYMFLVQVVFI